jgi:hypothetical protein
VESKSNRVLTVIFAALFLFNVGYLVMGFASIPLYYERVTTLTIAPTVLPGANYPTNESVQRSAAERGMTLSQYAMEQIVFAGAMVLLFMVVALLIVSRTRWNWFAWYSAFFLAFIAEFALYDQVFVARLLPLWFYEVGALLWPLVLLYLFLFPNGKPAPRRALWLVLPALAVHFTFQASAFILVLVPGTGLQAVIERVLEPLELVIVAVLVFILGCQVYRYLRVSTREEKQQTKWFLFGFVFFLLLSTVSDELGERNPYHEEVNLLIFAFVPLSVGIAILRYRLWDIDVIIRRTLTYGLITALLAIVFFGSVILLQQLFAGLTGSGQNELVTVLSTLAIAALFVPLRNRVQDTIDRRFNRKKYDAQHVLQEFAKTVRDETDLGKLTGRLIEVVDETMQPRSVSVWLKREQGKELTSETNKL